MVSIIPRPWGPRVPGGSSSWTRNVDSAERASSRDPPGPGRGGHRSLRGGRRGTESPKDLVPPEPPVARSPGQRRALSGREGVPRDGNPTPPRRGGLRRGRRDGPGSRRQKGARCSRPVSNRGPLACEASVMTATPRKPRVGAPLLCSGMRLRPGKRAPPGGPGRYCRRTARPRMCPTEGRRSTTAAERRHQTAPGGMRERRVPGGGGGGGGNGGGERRRDRRNALGGGRGLFNYWSERRSASGRPGGDSGVPAAALRPRRGWGDASPPSPPSRAVLPLPAAATSTPRGNRGASDLRGKFKRR